jgi:hypothetical protein
MTGRISNARTEIASRLEGLRNLPGLHAPERDAIEDASRSGSNVCASDTRQAKHARGNGFHTMHGRLGQHKLIAALSKSSEWQDSLKQLIGKFLFLFKKREMTGVFKPDHFLSGSGDCLTVLLD